MSVKKWLPVVCAAECGGWGGVDNEPDTRARLSARFLGFSPNRHFPQHGAMCAPECYTCKCLENDDEPM